jgi:heme-degrading monooxygenase HmoA
MIVTIFRSRLRPGVEEYPAMAERMDKLATSMPGYVAHNSYTAEDGERLTLAFFESEAAQDAWRKHPEHLQAQHAGRDVYYSEYRIHVCKLLRESEFKHQRRTGL